MRILIYIDKTAATSSFHSSKEILVLLVPQNWSESDE